MALDDKNKKRKLPSMPMPEKKGGNEQLDQQAEFPGGADSYNAEDMADDAGGEDNYKLPEDMDAMSKKDSKKDRGNGSLDHVANEDLMTAAKKRGLHKKGGK